MIAINYKIIILFIQWLNYWTGLFNWRENERKSQNSKVYYLVLIFGLQVCIDNSYVCK